MNSFAVLLTIASFRKLRSDACAIKVVITLLVCPGTSTGQHSCQGKQESLIADRPGKAQKTFQPPGSCANGHAQPMLHMKDT